MPEIRHAPSHNPLPTVLIVDDRPENLLSLQALLEEGNDCSLVTASSGEEALMLALSHDVALVLLDVQMPDMDGYEVARLMRQNPRTRDIPIIFITANAQDEKSALQGYQAGAIDYIYKPVSSAILQSKIRVLLQMERHRREVAQANAELDSARNYYQAILATAAEGILVASPEGRIEYANPAACLLLGDEARLRGQPLTRVLCPPGEQAQSWTATPLYQDWQQRRTHRDRDTLIYSADGSPVPVSLSCAPLPLPQLGLVVVFQDISVPKQLQQQLEHQAVTDALTGLLNRHGFMHALRAALSRFERHRQKVIALLYMDLDGFKAVNDTLGHQAGDQLLQSVSQRLLQCLRPYDVVARLGGDEFTVLIDGLANSEDSTRICAKIIETLSAPHEVKGTSVTIGASIGIATYPNCGEQPETLMQCADMAMYQAKKEGKNTYRFFTPEMNFRAKAKRLLEESLRSAISAEEFQLLLQPQIRLADNALRGVEVLLRWQHPAAGTIMPDLFMPLLEETGLIHTLGPWSIRQACTRFCERLPQLPGDSRLALNLSGRQFANQHLVQELKAILDDTGTPVDRLELELSEGALMNDVNHTRKTLWQLKDAGVNVVIDDFGSGYSSLAHLKQFPISALKIHEPFVRECAHSRRDQAIIQSVIQLGRNLGMEVIAVGVESEQQLEWLRNCKCDAAQGFLFSQPQPMDDSAALGRWLHGLRA